MNSNALQSCFKGWVIPLGVDIMDLTTGGVRGSRGIMVHLADWVVPISYFLKSTSLNGFQHVIFALKVAEVLLSWQNEQAVTVDFYSNLPKSDVVIIQMIIQIS